MIWILAGMLLGYAAGAFTVWYVLCEGKKKRAGRAGEQSVGGMDIQWQGDMPVRLKKQYDNFFAYDGTGRGQVNIEDE